MSGAGTLATICVVWRTFFPISCRKIFLRTYLISTYFPSQQQNWHNGAITYFLTQPKNWHNDTTEKVPPAHVKWVLSRVVYWFGIFGWYLLVFSWYFTNRYQRKTRLVHFGIKKLAGAPFSLQKGGFGTPFGRGSGPKNVIFFKWSQNHFWVV